MPRDATVYDYVVVLKDTNGGSVRRAGTLLSLLGMMMLAYRWTSIPESGASILFLTSGSVLTAWNLLRMRRRQPVRHWPALALTGIGLTLVPPFHPAGIAFLVLARLESFALKRTELGFSETGIRFNGLGGRRIAWSELRNVVLRDGLLTLDYLDNRLFQRDTDDLDDEEYEAGEEEFNIFCREQIRRHAVPPTPESN
ncbi:MAG: hypothetical protein EBZ67_08485 [Chitinophagia bacterium]|nr:hypothetical protein [Chitinophagia bacterium]